MEHTCTTFTKGCHRCELNRDERLSTLDNDALAVLSDSFFSCMSAIWATQKTLNYFGLNGEPTQLLREARKFLSKAKNMIEMENLSRKS